MQKRVAMLSTIDDATLMKVAEALGEEEAVKLIEILKNSDEITDDELANKTGIRLNNVRKILYKLYDHSLVSLRRTRDPKTGWFIFHWKLQPDQLEGFILSQKRRVFEKL
ncbi:MAG: transcription factor, partial [Candidatus Bathyarchaeia archaeon]